LSEDVRPSGTYKTPAEQREVLTPAEERFERLRQTTGLFLGPVAFLIMYFLPLPLPREQHTLAPVFGASFGFMMPVSTPQNAAVYGSGMIPITKMVRSGIVFDVIGLILIVLLIPVMARLILV
jgi:di/tricarboxylate transporter